MIELNAGDARCIVSPADGGRIASLMIGTRELLVSGSSAGDPMTWGCFPMVPWAGRVRRGSFRFDAKTFQLDLGLPPHAIHGTVYTQPWTVGDVGPNFVAMSCEIGDHWPFGGVTHQVIELRDDHLHCELSVTADQLAMPAQVGWHPWFLDPDVATLRFAKMYRRDAAGIPTGELVAQPPGPWDDCFVQPLGPLELDYGDVVATIESTCDHWVVYDEQDHATCIEPQSGPPDGLTLEPNRVEPGQTLARTMAIRWRAGRGS